MGLTGSHHTSFQGEEDKAPFKNSMIKEQMTQIRVKGDSIMQIIASSSAQKRPQLMDVVPQLEESPTSTGSNKKVLMKYFANNTHSGFYSPTNKDKN